MAAALLLTILATAVLVPLFADIAVAPGQRGFDGGLVAGRQSPEPSGSPLSK